MESLTNKRCILCIEPAGEICLLLGLMLHRDDITIQHVARIEAAAGFLEREHPGLVIIENSFAGNELAATVVLIRERAPTSRILMVSSDGDDAAKQASAAGVDLFLIRPFGKKELIEAALAMLN